MIPSSYIELARTGVHIDISNESHMPASLIELARVVANSGGHLTISGNGFMPASFLELARAGRGHLTIKF